MSAKAFLYKKQTLDCPVDFVTVDENRVRFVAFLVLTLAVAYVLGGGVLLPCFLLIDFMLRAFNLNAYSPLALLGGAMAKQTGLKSKPVDRAPKRFAAFVGVFFLAAIVITAFTGFVLTSKVITAILIVFASLESFLGFCAGCYLYSFINAFRKRA